jgi:hypothetical protein
MTENFYELFWQHGYRRLMVVSPHDDPMRYAGKRPAVLGPNGWYGVSVRTFEATPEQLPEWASWGGGGVGLRCDRDHIGIDIDSMSAEWVEKLKQIALEELGAIGARRIGRAPRTMLVYRVEETITYDQRRFDDGTEGGGLIELIAGETRWFVVHGVHPKTLVPYSWPDKVPRSEQLPVVTKAQLANFFARLDAELPKVAGKSNTLTDRAAVEQRALIVEDLSIVRQLLEKTPNLYEQTAYKELLELAVALRAVSQDDPETGEEIFLEFAERTDLEEQTENPLRVYRSLQPPFAFGMSYILQFAHGRSDDVEQLPFQAAVASLNYDASPPEYVAPEPSLFDLSVREPVASGLEPIRWARPSEWAGRTPKPREWEVPGWIPRYEVTLFYGDGGIGKTLAIHQYATAAAAGVAWLGQQARKAKVMCFFCEDSEDELMRRQIDINKALGVSFEDIDANLRIASRKYMDNLLVLWDRNTGALKRQAVWEQLRADAVEFGAEVLVIDTIADTFSGSEIDRAQVNAFVKSCLGRLAQEIGGSVIALGHPSVSGKASGSGTSGSTAWSNAVRSRIYLRYPKGVEKGNIRELEGMKLNYGPKGNTLKIRWANGAFDVIASSTAPVDDIVPKSFSTSALVGTVEDLCDAAVFDAVVALPGVALVLKANSIHYAPKVLKRREPDLLVAFGVQEIEEALARLERRGAIVAGQVGKDASRRPVLGYAVDASKMSVGSGSIFD